jgi:hypothetical protein
MEVIDITTASHARCAFGQAGGMNMILAGAASETLKETL